MIFTLKGFRPLPGDLISQFKPNLDETNVIYSFRPLPGDLISQYFLTNSLLEIRPCFRPLPGDLISQFLMNPPFSNGDAHLVSVPFPGILFLNPVLYMPNLNWIPKPNCGAKPNPTLE